MKLLPILIQHILHQKRRKNAKVQSHLTDKDQKKIANTKKIVKKLVAKKHLLVAKRVKKIAKMKKIVKKNV
jgi:hypothetical protein